LTNFSKSRTMKKKYDFINNATSKDEADETIDILLKLFDITPLYKNTLLNALKTNGSDFEDSIIHKCTEKSNIDYL